VIHYLDDYLIIGAPSSPECAEGLHILLGVFKHLGLPVAVEKLEGPALCLGLELDTRALEVHLLLKKLEEIRELLGAWRGRKVCTRKELESLVGKLSFASQVVPPGKTFLGRMYELPTTNSA
jgi:hypothetical protein